MGQRTYLLYLLLCLSCSASGQPEARLLQRAWVLVQANDSLWPGWAHCNRQTIIIYPDTEFLFGALPAPQVGFAAQGMHSHLGLSLQTRANTLFASMLATYPAVNGVPTIVMGTPAATHKHPAEWVLTWAHEHFHQWQMLQPDYFAGLAALDLAHGDASGQWMINYAFPYTDSHVVDTYARAAQLLAGAAQGQAGALQAFETALAALRQALNPADYRYLQLQLAQEGIARYTELKLEGNPQALQEIWTTLNNSNLRRDGRTAFYAFGAAMGLLLDSCQPGWRRRYASYPWELDRLLPSP